MRNRIRRAVFALLLAAMLVASVFVVTPSVGQADPGPGPTVQLAVCLDGSGSINSSEFQIMRDGLAAAVADSAIVPHDGSVELTVVQFSQSKTIVEVGPAVVTNSNAGTIAAAINLITKGYGLTPMDAGIELATSEITGSPHFATASWQIINISSDGAPTYRSAAIDARNDAIIAGIDEIDAEAINASTTDFNWMVNSLVFPLPGVVAPPYPPRPPDPAFRGFVCEVDSSVEYAPAIGAKLERAPPPPERYIYSVKFLCGRAKSAEVGVQPAEYATAINIHNFLDEKVVLQKKVVIANREGEPMGEVTQYTKLGLGPNEAVEVDCVDIYGLLGQKSPVFLKGFVVIESTQPLNVVAVYTTRSGWWWGREVSINVEPISPALSP